MPGTEPPISVSLCSVSSAAVCKHSAGRPEEARGRAIVVWGTTPPLAKGAGRLVRASRERIRGGGPNAAEQPFSTHRAHDPRGHRPVAAALWPAPRSYGASEHSCRATIVCQRPHWGGRRTAGDRLPPTRSEQVSGISGTSASGPYLAVPLTYGGGLLSGVKLKKHDQELTLGSKVGLLHEPTSNATRGVRHHSFARQARSASSQAASG
jgi:hypothetical protein